MYAGIFPMLSRGSFALFYGGCCLISSLQEFGSPISPVFMSLSLCFQFVFFVYKIIKFQNNSIRSPGCITYNSAHLTSFDKNISDQLFLELQRTLLSGYHNIYSLSTLGIY